MSHTNLLMSSQQFLPVLQHVSYQSSDVFVRILTCATTCLIPIFWCLRNNSYLCYNMSHTNLLMSSQQFLPVLQHVSYQSSDVFATILTCATTCLIPIFWCLCNNSYLCYNMYHTNLLMSSQQFLPVLQHVSYQSSDVFATILTCATTCLIHVPIFWCLRKNSYLCYNMSHTNLLMSLQQFLPVLQHVSYQSSDVFATILTCVTTCLIPIFWCLRNNSYLCYNMSHTNLLMSSQQFLPVLQHVSYQSSDVFATILTCATTCLIPIFWCLRNNSYLCYNMSHTNLLMSS